MALPIYAMSCFKLPEDVCEKITSPMREFWWSSGNNKKKIPWVAGSYCVKTKNLVVQASEILKSSTSLSLRNKLGEYGRTPLPFWLGFYSNATLLNLLFWNVALAQDRPMSGTVFSLQEKHVFIASNKRYGWIVQRSQKRYVYARDNRSLPFDSGVQQRYCMGV